MNVDVRVFPSRFVDSVVQMAAVRAMRQVTGVHWAGAGMATQANVDSLLAQGVAHDVLTGRGPDDFYVAVRADGEESAAQAFAAAEEAAGAAAEPEPGPSAESPPRSVREAVARHPEANVAVVSVPAEYAALASFQALTSGLHVLLFSDNVPLEKEVALKDYARSRGLLLMGPGAGTAVLSGVGLGFANVVTRGAVGVVAAAGTGAQEVMCLLDRWGAGVSQVIGLGGRDLSKAVGGRAALAAVEAMREDPETQVMLLVSKPPDAAVAARVLEAAGDLPVVATLLGAARTAAAEGSVLVADTLEAGALATLRLLDKPTPDPTITVGPSVHAVCERLDVSRTLVRGLFSGGSLCFESLVILQRLLGEIRSNTPINPAWGLPAPPGSHQCLDLGEEEYTRGRPHPMIDAESRVDPLREHSGDPDVAAVILDVVLGHGAHPDPAAVLAPVCGEVMTADGPQVVVHVVGSDADPQGYDEQRERFARAGCLLTETSARAAVVAAAIATRRPDLAVRTP